MRYRCEGPLSFLQRKSLLRVTFFIPLSMTLKNTAAGSSYLSALSRQLRHKDWIFCRRYWRYMWCLHRLQSHQRRGGTIFPRSHIPRFILRKISPAGRRQSGKGDQINSQSDYTNNLLE